MPLTLADKARRLTDAQIGHRLACLETIVARAHPQDLPALNRLFQTLLDEQVRRDLEAKGGAA